MICSIEIYILIRFFVSEDDINPEKIAKIILTAILTLMTTFTFLGM